MTLDQVEAVIWQQARRLTGGDRISRELAIAAVRLAVLAYAEEQAGPIVAARRSSAPGNRRTETARQ